MKGCKLTENEIGIRAHLVAIEHKGIVAYNEAFYLLALISEAESATSSYERFLEAVWKMPDELAFRNFLNFLSHCAAISRMFWPPIPRDKRLKELTNARASKLRYAFELTENSPLKKRSLRNVAEHYDEFLDEFLLRDPIGPILPTRILSSDILEKSEVGHVFQFINPVYNYAIILGNKLEYEGMIDAVRNVLKRATAMMANGGRLIHAKAAARLST